MNIYYSQLKSLLNNPETALRIAIFDTKNHSNQNAFFNWELNEPGSTIGMINAYKKMLDSIDLELSLPLIHEIHLSLITIKKYGNYDFLNLDKNKIHIDTKLKFELMATSEKADDLLTRLNNEAASLQNKFNFTELPYKAQISSNAYDKLTPHMLDALSCGANPVDYTNSIIEDYNNSTNINISNDQILEKILLLARNLERVHIYSDFNCRTFCVILLNREFIKHNLPPVALEDPNIFDSFSLEDLKREIYKGRDNFTKIFEIGKLHENHPTNKHWRNHITSEINYHNRLLSLLNDLINLTASNELDNEKIIHYLEEISNLSNKIEHNNHQFANKISSFLKALVSYSSQNQLKEFHMNCLNYEYEISEMTQCYIKALKQFDIVTNYKYNI